MWRIRTEVPRFWIPSGNRKREELRPFTRYSRILNSLSPEEWENLGLDEVLTSSPLQNIQLPELQSDVSPLAGEIVMVSAPPCGEVDDTGVVHQGDEVGHQGDEVCAKVLRITFCCNKILEIYLCLKLYCLSSCP